MRTVRLLNKMSLLVGGYEKDFRTEDISFDGLEAHEYKEVWKATDLPLRIVAALDKFKTPIDRLQNQIDILVSDPIFLVNSRVDTDDLVTFFRNNQAALRKVAHRPRINTILKNIVHSLSNITKDGEIGEDIGEISDILIGDGLYSHGLIKDSSNTAFNYAASKLRNAPRAKNINFLRSRVNVMFKPRKKYI